MSDTGRDLLTQEEIDALLAEVDAGGAPVLDPAEQAAVGDLLRAVVGPLGAVLEASGVLVDAGDDPELAIVPAADAAQAFGAGAITACLGDPSQLEVMLSAASFPEDGPDAGDLDAAAAGIQHAVAGVVGRPVTVRVEWRRAFDPGARGTAAGDAATVVGTWGGDAGFMVAAPLAGLRELLEEADREPEAVAPAAPPAAAPAEYPELAPEGDDRLTRAALELLFDVPLEVTAVLGRTRRQVGEVLALGPGSVLELDKVAGEPIEVLVNGKLIARGEVVVIDEHFGIRITDIVSRAERLRQLR
ncbi:MAG TPA: flagellar motor switch protein FliN [Bacillota bacterium]